jgi:hypothetical protein
MALHRYVILWHHDVDEPHFDLMFETYPRSDLATWRSPRWPIEERVDLVRLKDHRRFYLEYEGDLTDRRGRVDRVAGGDCELEIEEGGVWNIRLITGAPPMRLMLRQIDGAAWIAEPSDRPAV